MALDYGTTAHNMHHTNQLGTYKNVLVIACKSNTIQLTFLIFSVFKTLSFIYFITFYHKI